MSETYKDRDWLFDQYWNQGKSMDMIANETGKSKTTIQYWMKKFNIVRRSISEANRGKIFSKERRKKMSVPHKRPKGGKHKHGTGYMMTLNYDHPRTDKNNHYVFDHILVAEEMLGRYLKPDEVVHHIDFNKLNNDPENLFIFKDASNHQKVKASLFKLISHLIDKGIIKFDGEDYTIG